MNNPKLGRLVTFLTILFLTLVVATFVSYFLWRQTPAIFVTLGFCAIGVRVATYLINHFNR
ncbi:hypothetical protein HQ45_09145 [Porphyromonas crevioricanis]|uniref:Uncharacterized protein n=2 Tax=Porphyromonas crevioricanis TaxID=393921 RepID=A0A0A2G0Q9_9PORP|nr:hypothetical protein [Porphyromonas crevioricanis]KGN88836.1 hypothetical protein HQ45_09145 [Porphyromonas crevioricanis]KGN95920.1 hypothetical protein HQ38_02900 [Porphyromonas crevioricanis]SJZ72028.1 hypothetical protein SAMN02745203_00656 [Porphyromonas crevioricanis]SQH73537.1 Uncharacterised protein [Porphyromonas crevioricanis]GAD06154.1 hypothetical protein PORCRE_1876 [Porphyromonas crevioricanis JCM 15906]